MVREGVHVMTDRLFHFAAVHALAYDFVARRGTLYMAAGNCCDMVDCIRFFARIDPQVQVIETIAGEKADTSYHRLDDGRWRARDPFDRWWDACEIPAHA